MIQNKQHLEELQPLANQLGNSKPLFNDANVAAANQIFGTVQDRQASIAPKPVINQPLVEPIQDPALNGKTYV